MFGIPDYIGYATAGASDYAVLGKWWAIPRGLGLVEAATLPMAVETAVHSLDLQDGGGPDDYDQRRRDDDGLRRRPDRTAAGRPRYHKRRRNLR